MKIIVLNGSPKGDTSVTMQYVHYVAKLNPGCEFKIYNISQQIRKIEKDQAYFDEILAQVRAADGVLWAFPLYILTVHAHYKRFIELLFERGAGEAFRDKYAATLSTSIHFFDHTAHNYMHAICDDLGMRFVDSFSPYMYDLTKLAGQEQTAGFGKRFLAAIEQQVPTQRQYAPLVRREFVYQPGLAQASVSTAGKRVVILHDGGRPGSNLATMVARCRDAFAGPVQVVDLNDVLIKASCQGCMRCGYNYHCAYEGKDGFIDFYRSTVMQADVLVYAGTLVDRQLSSRWKMVLDRAFFNTHTPVLTGKQMAFVLSGPFSQNANLREVLLGYTEFQGANVVGFASDEFGSSAEIDAVLDGLMAAVLRATLAADSHPQTFRGIGGMKVFRDDIWGPLRMVFQADHRAYRRLGFYRTFPQRDWNALLTNAIMIPLTHLAGFRKEFVRRTPQEMIRPLRKVVGKMPA
ncbi:MAG: hypothetical protein GYA17_10350 [Chloroflexi bacterium]|nr:hypothetical protein [Chloroflexota bacterium]